MILLAAFVIAAISPTPAPTATPPPDPCTLVTVVEASALLGYPVLAPDEPTRRAGRCLFTTRSLSDDGSVAYAIVRAPQLAQLTRYYAIVARMCAGVAPGAPREMICKQYVQLAGVTNLDDYFAARTSGSSAQPVPSLGEHAIATDQGLFIRESDSVLEANVQRNQLFELEPSLKLAQLLLERMAPPLH